MTWSWISIGSNIDRERNIRAAIAALRTKFGEIKLSPVYETEAIGFSGDPFYNLVVGIETPFPPADTSIFLKQIEQSLGRKLGEKKFASRCIDLDLLTYADQIIEEPTLNLPRNEILEYAFVLKPLADVAPLEVHPTTGINYTDLWNQFLGEKSLEVTQFDLSTSP